MKFLNSWLDEMQNNLVQVVVVEITQVMICMDCTINFNTQVVQTWIKNIS